MNEMLACERIKRVFYLPENFWFLNEFFACCCCWLEDEDDGELILNWSYIGDFELLLLLFKNISCFCCCCSVDDDWSLYKNKINFKVSKKKYYLFFWFSSYKLTQFLYKNKVLSNQLNFLIETNFWKR